VSIPVSRTGGESHDDGEVSCVALALVFQAAASRGDSLESLARGTRVGLDHLMAWDRRIGWDTFRTVMANAGETFPPEALVALGRRSPRARVARPYASVVRLLDDPVAPYRFMARPGTGIFAQLFTCLQPALEDHGGGRLELSLRLEPGRAPCPEMLHLVHGGLAALAPLVGWPEPAVSMEPLADGARYRITLAPRPSPWRRLARRARLPFSSGAPPARCSGRWPTSTLTITAWPGPLPTGTAPRRATPTRRTASAPCSTPRPWPWPSSGSATAASST